MHPDLTLGARGFRDPSRCLLALVVGVGCVRRCRFCSAVLLGALSPRCPSSWRGARRRLEKASLNILPSTGGASVFGCGAWDTDFSATDCVPVALRLSLPFGTLFRLQASLSQSQKTLRRMLCLSSCLAPYLLLPLARSKFWLFFSSKLLCQDVPREGFDDTYIQAAKANNPRKSII